jgi:hypothetical protein
LGQLQDQHPAVLGPIVPPLDDLDPTVLADRHQRVVLEEDLRAGSWLCLNHVFRMEWIELLNHGGAVRRSACGEDVALYGSELPDGSICGCAGHRRQRDREHGKPACGQGYRRQTSPPLFSGEIHVA